MNEKPGETPNPLNPNGVETGTPQRPNVVDNFINSAPLDANPAEPISPAQTTEEPTTLEAQPEVATEAEAAYEAEQPTPTPLTRSMEKAAPENPAKPKRKKTGLIIGIVICLLVAIGCGIAAAIVANTNTDVVTKAMGKLMSGEAPNNLAVDGTIEVASSDPDSPFSNLKIELDSEIITSSMINSTEATLDVYMRDKSSFSLELEGIYAGNGDLFIKASEVSNKPELLYDAEDLEDQPEVNAGEEATIDQDLVTSDTEGMAEMLGILQLIDNEWLRIPLSDLSELSGEVTEDSSLTCLTNLAQKTYENSNSLSSYYSKNPFIASTTENIPINNNKYPVHEVSIDNEKFANFVNSIKGSEPATDLYNCLGYEGEVDTNEVIEAVGKLPALYVEVDPEYNFTRLYFALSDMENQTTVVVDLNFSYPANVNVSEPAEYKDLSAMMEELFTDMYALPEDENAYIIEE